MAPNVASNGMMANGNGIHMNGKAPAQSNGNGTAVRPAVAPKSTHEDRWAGVERPYSQVCDTKKHRMKVASLRQRPRSLQSQAVWHNAVSL
jgi:hypothetical protein